IKGTGFSSVSGYVTYVLREVLSEEEEEEKEVFSKEDEEKIKARLKALGYIE
ncbi:CopG family transcriptional regulator, partial [Candidatus Bathyarchaeota archaeon]